MQLCDQHMQHFQCSHKTTTIDLENRKPIMSDYHLVQLNIAKMMLDINDES